MHEADTSFAEALSQYRATIKLNPVADQTLLEQATNTYAAFRTQRLAYEDLILRGDREAAAAFLEHDLIPVFLPAINAAEDLIKYNHGNSIALSRSIRSSVHQLYWAVAVVVVLAFGCGVVLASNLTIRRRELTELQESEEKFSKAFRSSPNGIAITDLDTGRYIEANDSFCRILGYPPAEVIGYTTHDKGIWRNEEQFSSVLQPLLAGGELLQQELKVRTRYGIDRTLALNAELIELGGNRCVVTLIEDITERKRATEQIEMLKVSIDKHFDAAFWMDTSNEFVYVNDAACTSLGYAREELLGRPVSMVAPNATARRLQDVWKQLRETGFFTGESIHRRKDGSEFPVEIVDSYFRYEGREFNCGFARDISSRRLLERKQAELANIVEYSEDAIIGKSLEGIITSWNRGAEKIFGYTSSEAVGQPLLLIFPPEKKQEEAEILARISRGETVEHFDSERIRKDGRRIYISATISPLKDGNGNVVGASKIVRDITAQKRAEQELRWRTAFFEAHVHSAADGILVVDSSGKKMLQNRRVIELWKIPPAIAADPDDSPQLQFVLSQVKDPQAFAARVAELKARPDEIGWDEIELLDGTIMERHAAPVRGSDGTYYGRVWTFHDVTNTRRRELRFRRLFESKMQGVFFWKADGSISDSNDCFLQIVGYTQEDLAAGLVNWQALTPPEHRKADERALEELSVRRTCTPYEKEFIRKDGLHVPILIGAATFEDPHEGVCFILDLTERKKMEQQFLRAQRMESIGTLASGMAHDLNNILTPITMSVAVLRMRGSEETRGSLCDVIESSAVRGAQIVKQMLTFRRGVEGERLALQIELLITELAQMIRSTFPKDITLESVVAPDLWLVLGDATQLHQVLLNLCVNARDAMPDGGSLRLSAANLEIDDNFASMLPEITPGPHVLLEVTDTGSGIPPEIMDRIFDPFFTTKGVGKGTGLGLSTVHGIVKSHGGLLKVVSTPGKGATFQIYLPAAPDQQTLAQASASALAPRGHGDLVLVVDDEPAITNAASSVLEAHGYRVLLASDAAAALVMVSQQPQDVALVLTDILMPVMNGVLFLRTLRKINPTVPVIASTGLCDETQLAAMRSLGVTTILHKPYNASALLRAVHAALLPRS